MSFNRLPYDMCSYKYSLEESTAPGSYYLNTSTLINFFYGSIQGGLKCDTGVCVYVPGIDDAFTFTLTTNF